MNDDWKNTQQDLTITISVDQTPEQALEAINDARGWWSGNIEGPSDMLEDELSNRYAAAPRSNRSAAAGA